MKFKVGDFITCQNHDKTDYVTYQVTKVILERGLYDLKTNNYQYHNVWVGKFFKLSTDRQIAEYIAEKFEK
jgi:hypothetical protein